jgi:hypothetical protein
MTKVDKKIQEICERRKFTSFWEAFDYMKLASYEEVEAIMIALQLFNGKIWDRVVFATKTYDDMSDDVCMSGGTYIMRVMGDDDGADDETDIENDPSPLRIVADTDDVSPFCTDVMTVKLFIMTEEADEVYLPVYRAYAETRDYEPNETLEKHIKPLTTRLTTEIGIKLFNSWKK